MLTIITPCSRPDNLPAMFDSISFPKIDKWYIVYDTSNNRTYTHQFTNHPQIIELEADGTSVNSAVGHYQRNFALRIITKLKKNGYVYFLDDDNILHPDFLDSVDFSVPDRFYTFDQFLKRLNDHQYEYRLGNVLKINSIDMAQFCFDISIKSPDLFFHNSYYGADGLLVEQLYQQASSNHIYIPKILCYYNKLNPKN